MSATPDPSNPTPAPTRAHAFCTTRWTEVLAARGRSPEARDALRGLCEAYYEPIVSFLARSEGEGAARDLAHEFFAALLAGDRLAHLEREGGRFRSYLLGALKHFVWRRRAHEARQKRGGGAAAIPLVRGEHGTEEVVLVDEATLSPEAAFDREWATTLLARALARLRAECFAEGKEAQFELLKPWLTGEATHGEQADAARELGLAAGALKSAVHRLRQRFRQQVKSEVSDTLNDTADVEEEMRTLLLAFTPQKAAISAQPFAAREPGTE